MRESKKKENVIDEDINSGIFFEVTPPDKFYVTGLKLHVN